ncbi:extracellular solute-binding protein [Streptomyces antimycoticus]|uniref:Sugar ABC transporter substrate-binding protein n=1 Tax=Streptomyces antimycoticus TaxID=68175 RepID=A0A4D4KSI8_9ACTN|nr:extracellular solute-binding protein [Streptomyces antimycoticus]GDY48793.1 sugar ABC transporter substrate-binding protein [Streptomyces antimycoticus]
MVAAHHRTAHRILALVSVTAALPVLAGCGGVSFADTESPTFTTLGYGMDDALASDRVDTARAALKGLHVQVNEGQFDEQQFLSAVAAGDPPDAVHMDRTLIGGYAARGALVPLTDCIRKEHIDLGVFNKTALTEGSLDGTVYALPDSYNSRLLLIDDNVVKQNGMRESDVRTDDWHALRTLTERLKKTDGAKLTRIGFDPKIPEFFPLWAKANGADLISADGRTAHLNDPHVVQALTYAVGLINAQGGWGRFKSLRDSFDQFGAKNQFATDQVGAMPMEDWYIDVLADSSPDVPLSTGAFKDRRGKALNWTSGFGWAIPRGTRHLARACTFIKTMTATSTWVHAARTKAEEVRDAGHAYTGDVTGNLRADRIIEQEVWKPTGNPAFDRATRTLFDISREGFAVPSNAAGTEFKNAWQNAVNRVLSGEQSPQQALDQAQKVAQSALDIANEGR